MLADSSQPPLLQGFWKRSSHVEVLGSDLIRRADSKRVI
jgi:hypothetical protein